MNPIFFNEQGKGLPIVLLHGFCEDHEIWNPIVQELAKDFRIITPDLPGFGKSLLPARSFSIQDIGNLLTDWLLTHEFEKPVIIGHSLGGYVALAMAQSNPNSVSGLGLFHSTAFADTEEKKSNRNKTVDFVIKNGVAPFVDTFVPSLFYQKENYAIPLVRKIALRTSLETLIGYSKAMRDRPSSEDFLRSFSNPFLVMAGVHDSVIPLSVLQQVSQWAAKTMFFALENTGHMGMFENKMDTIKCIRDFAEWCSSQKG
jgi:pimeloyl-ACP methyl ester carboxylesterase